ncbi:uncharacterized protein LOC124836905 [Vigna umbellata]|uniref:uncharacterized protein LOC124836905 n=1 Tax=Vigna umbellata TaxID=87088 RepID=UPI001F5E3DC9|nr:uncharacterized protein LOC124836905 [Vigna umbellata]
MKLENYRAWKSTRELKNASAKVTVRKKSSSMTRRESTLVYRMDAVGGCSEAKGGRLAKKRKKKKIAPWWWEWKQWFEFSGSSYWCTCTHWIAVSRSCGPSECEPYTSVLAFISRKWCCSL